MRLLVLLLTLLLPVAARAETCTHTVSVSGNELLRDGAPWAPHGMNSVVAFAWPNSNSTYLNALTIWNSDNGATDVAQLRSWGADTVRLQLAGPYLDPFSPLYNSGYEPYIAGLVQTWCSAGFSVILSMEMQGNQSGWTANSVSYAWDSYYRAWQNLAPIWLTEPNVILELVNEPSQSSVAGVDITVPTRMPVNNQWQSWVDNINWLTARMRGAGSPNVFGIDGIGSSHFLTNAPSSLSGDPGNQWFWITHAYPMQFRPVTIENNNFTADEMEWSWGNVGAYKPVLIDEWADGTNGASGGGPYCFDSTSGTPTDSPTVATTLLTYLQDAALDTGVMVTAGDNVTIPPVVNTGNGTVTALSRGASVVHGNYVVAMTSTTSGTVTDPNGTSLGTATVGTPFTSSEINFTITGSPAAADKFVLTVPTHSPIGLVPWDWEGHATSQWVNDYTNWTPTYFYTTPFSCSSAPLAPANGPGYMVQQYFLNPSAAIVSPTTPPP